MFSKKEKQKIADAVEGVLLEIAHPEMPKERLSFELRVDGKETWSFALIVPNWVWEEQGAVKNQNPWNEKARETLNG